MSLLEAGTPAPDFQVADQYGKVRSLSDYADKFVVLYFYPKDDTSGCTKEACGFNDNLDAFMDLNTEIIGVSNDTVKEHQAFIERYDLGFTLLADTAHDITTKYGVDNGPDKGPSRVTYLIDADGTIVRAYADVTPTSHAQQILADLRGLTATA